MEEEETVADPDCSDLFRTLPKSVGHQTYEAGEVAVVANLATWAGGGRRVSVRVGGHIRFRIGLLRVRRAVRRRVCWMLQRGEQVVPVSCVQRVEAPTRQGTGVVNFWNDEPEVPD